MDVNRESNYVKRVSRVVKRVSRTQTLSRAWASCQDSLCNSRSQKVSRGCQESAKGMPRRCHEGVKRVPRRCHERAQCRGCQKGVTLKRASRGSLDECWICVLDLLLCLSMQNYYELEFFQLLLEPDGGD